VNRLLRIEVNREQFYACARQEAIEIVRNLLTWSAEEVYFDEGAHPPKDQFLIGLRLTSLLPSLLSSTPPSIVSISNQGSVREEPSFPQFVPSTLIKTPRLFVGKASLPETPPTIPITPHPLLFKKSKPTIEEPSTPQTPCPSIPVTPLPPTLEAPGSALQDQPVPAISNIVTLVQRAIVPSSIASLIHPSPDALTVKLSKTGRHQSSVLRWEVLLILAVLLVAALVHGFNMFHFPYYEDDEGTYMSQAWAVVHEGKLAYYTYWYDHAPLGWIQIAAWTVITGSFHTFGPAINSGRALMLLMQVGSTLMLYCITRRISRSVIVAVIASLLFALSPYGIYFHRRVLLDNITTFWMLLSILLLVSRRLSLKRVWLSATALGISILSKEPTIFLVPVLAYLVFYRTDKSHRWFATIGWIALVCSIVSLYILMAILKGELFPTGTLLGGTAPHVSLLGTLQFQASRGKDGGLLDFHSGFWQLTKVWAQDDPMLVVGGSLCAILSVLMIKTQRLVGIIGLTTLSLYAFLGRGGEVIGFYLVPLLPLLALNIGLVLGFIVKRLTTLLVGSTGITIARIIEMVLVGLCLISILAGYTSPGLGFKDNSFILWNSSQADAQNQAAQWIENHLPVSSHMIIDESMWTDLYDNGYRFADYYWKVQEDPAIRDKIYHNNWRNFDYVVTTTQMLTDMKNQNMVLVEAALAHSTLLAHFDTGGWPIEIRKVNK
jgi:hypothetical protein